MHPTKRVRITENTKAMRNGDFDIVSGKFTSPLTTNYYDLCKQRVSTIFSAGKKMFTRAKDETEASTTIGVVDFDECNYLD
jgi:hypothetical protein